MNSRLKILITAVILILLALAAYYLINKITNRATEISDCFLEEKQCNKKWGCEWEPFRALGCSPDEICTMDLIGGCRLKEKKSVYYGDTNYSYSRFEGNDQVGECQINSQCTTGGCSGEICDDKIDIGGSLCYAVEKSPQAKNCQCVNTRCIWTK